MSKAHFITSSQITAICKGAQKAGFVAEIEIGDVLIRLMPADDYKEKIKPARTGTPYDDDMPIL
ncbi:hypothetical protein D8666_22610 [Ochrobactrum soli]|uniref:hypothetical protein n=1 Tax=Ochrobactrum soli TaxID=2448455 RepID=UPI000EF252D2|nr:hypothetical protein [[Ochrobactrum] soli]RLL64602.1 hypothetical protein D8666_22610 [[Ochrobactrum] soli]